MKRCPIAAKIAGSILCFVLNYIFSHRGMKVFLIISKASLSLSHHTLSMEILSSPVTA